MSRIETCAAVVQDKVGVDWKSMHDGPRLAADWSISRRGAAIFNCTNNRTISRSLQFVISGLRNQLARKTTTSSQHCPNMLVVSQSAREQ